MKTQFVYSNNYDFALIGLDKLHPFDGKKFSKAWEILSNTIGGDVTKMLTIPENPVDDDTLLQVHSSQYLQSLTLSKTIANIIEVSLVRYIPNSILQSQLIKPIRFATSGTLLATEKALQNCIAMNFGGGFHHAFPDHGEGFSVFADAALSIHQSRKKGAISNTDNIVMIDLDAHRGNGFEHIFQHDSAVHIFDMYNFQVYPGLHNGDPDEYPYIIPLKAGSNDDRYLKTLKDELIPFLDSVDNIRLAFYNAGTDVIKNDPIGGLSVSYEGVAERDQFVMQQLATRQIPTVIMTSGGYSKESYKLIADLAMLLLTLDV